MRLIIHAGTFKTGTTAIQNYFFENRKELSGRGLLYPRTGLFTKDPYGPRHKRLTYSGHKNLERWEKLQQELEASKAKVVLISCEGFWQFPKRAGEIMERVKAYKPSIVVGLRRQDRFVASWHLQRIKHMQDLTSPEEIAAKADKWLHYFKAAQIWTEAFGEGNVRPFLYDEVAKDSLRSLFDAADLTSEFQLASTDLYKSKNPTPNEWTPEQVMGEEFTREIIAHYAEDNAKLFAKYFPGATDWPSLR